MVMLDLASARRVRGIRDWRRPSATFLYRLYAEGGDLLYVGVTTREPAHRFNGHARVKRWWPQVAYVELHEYDENHEALGAEREAIRSESPRFNVRSGATHEALGSAS